MMMKKLIATLGFILTMGTSLAVATSVSDPHTQTTLSESIIRNRVCIESPQIPDKKCDYADVTLVDDTYACLSISGNHTVVPSNGRVQFTCTASDNTVGHNYKINCGNGKILTGYKNAGESFVDICVYEDTTSPYSVACYVDDEEQLNPSCAAQLGYTIPDNPCGNGVVDSSIEQCDLGGAYNQMVQCSDSSCSEMGESDYFCMNCAIVYRGNFVYEPAECRYSDTPISVMNNEYVPYWWKLYDKNTQKFTKNEGECDTYDGDKTLILDDEDTLRCYFVVYNGKYNQDNPNEERMESIAEFNEYCRNFDENHTYPAIFDYFREHHNWNDGKGPDGIDYNTVNALTAGHSENEFGEYKLVLQKVTYKVCNKSTRNWDDGIRYGAICEVNFAVTQPYIMQISTFGVNPVASNNESLSKYYAMDGKKILTKTDLSTVIETDNDNYAVEQNVKDKFDEFKKKYESLAVTVDRNSIVAGNTTINQMFGSNNNIEYVKKVPNKSIYFIKGNGKLVLSQDNIENLAPAYTIIVEGMDVEIVGNVLQYAMIVTNQKMSFKDSGPKGNMGCAEGGQVVQGIYVALSGFKAANEHLINNTIENNKKWCPWGGLHVKGVLIGDNIEAISNNKRSQLNSWFNAPNPSESAKKRARRETIIKGASLLIEYNPSLWKTLPPGAEIFTESLEVYRK